MSGSGTDDPQACSTPESPRAKKYGCEICGAKLSRAAHLQRHQKLHSTTSEVEAFACTACDKQFTRKDVYQRHRRSVHGPGRLRRNGRKKSCHRCIKYKLRCSRELPCSACLDRGVECLYDVRPSAAGAQNSNEPSQDGTLRADEGSLWQPQTLSDLASAAGFIEQSASNTDLNLSSVNVESHQAQNGGELDWSLMNGHPEYASPTTLSAENHTPHFPQFESYDWDVLRSSRMDWLGCETEASDGPVPQSLSNDAAFNTESIGQPEHTSPLTTSTNLHNIAACVPSTDNCPPPEIPAFVEPAISAPPISSSTNISRTDHITASLSSSREKESKETWPAVLDRGGNETWPFDYTSNKGFRKITLPPLREVLEQTVGHRPSIEKNTLHDLIKILSAPHIPSLNDTPALEALPAVAFLGEFVKIYLAEFHAVLPVIHVPTWRIEKCPTALLAAMACIGATYSTAEGSNEVAALLAEITQRALFWMGQQDSTAFRNSSYITASCFHQIYSLGTGNRRLYEIADASRGLLVTSLRGLGILSSDTEHNDVYALDPKQLKKMSAPALEASWLQWRDKEMEKRISWSVFEFDCVLSTLTSKRGAFRIAELPSRLPCCENIWSAHSAQAWVAILPFATSSPPGMLFYPLLQDIIAGKPVPGHTPAWGKRLCVHALSRMLWDLREVEDAGINNLGLSALATAHQETKHSLLQALLALEAALSRPTSTFEIVNMNIGSLGAHHAHLSDAHEAMDLVIYIFRNSGRETSGSRELDTAKDRLRYMFARDAVAARRLAFHAASIVGVARECAINTPCETMRVFMGYAFLLAFIKFFPVPAQHARRHCSAVVAPPPKLDEIPWTRSPEEAARVQKWVESGGPASLEGVANVCDVRDFEALKQAALQTMRDLRVWGIAGKFHRTISNFG
ncbi:hypothetical protein BS50DRAFT_174443 [Corynespora cassiicola Philippines]|uniref:C2H2 type zinc finger domain protein n=1 Tax=Corynespora cassiicola Philippines TaxID=1448308 RepID=A0A2T2P5F9_CORCC|nr:hypothetical protein BS50DRAFT_174443 [Corynespora cassiicola Philippines]